MASRMRALGTSCGVLLVIMCALCCSPSVLAGSEGSVVVRICFAYEGEAEEPLAGATVTLSSPAGEQHRALTDVDGIAPLRVPPGENYTLRVESPGSESFEKGKIAVVSGRATPIQVTLRPDLRGLAKLRIRVTAQAESECSATGQSNYVKVQTTNGAHAWVNPVARTEWVDFYLPVSQQYEVLVRRAGFLEARIGEVKLPRQGPTTITVVLMPDPRCSKPGGAASSPP